ncbi:hypothetical protein M0R89_02255 [Halorussus limi]|uniref:DUF835 domain-containing protein n=1 Tax=Halorussus limi TaxID=2938695 RepID=A0A8U0HVY6_9EURY|nr:hypothetical protein [Halorussus limi]UPV74903.1 hypothetical protein M0R89_02255 [Halorussus limi]
MDEAARSRDGALGREDPTPGAFAPGGSQTLVRTPTDADPLAALPERAYGNLLVVSARDHPKRLEARLERGGHDPANVGVVPVVPATCDYDGDLWTTDSVSPNDLTGIAMRFSDAIRHVESGTGWVVLDALGVLLMYADADRVCRFFQTLTNRVRAREVNGMYGANPDAIADETYERLRSMCDAERELG